MHVLNTLGPIFLVIFLGFLLRYFRFFDDRAVRTMNACCYWIGLPSLLVAKIAGASTAGGIFRNTSLVIAIGTAVLLLIGTLTGLLLRLRSRRLATFVHVTFRGNLAYIGLPVVSFAYAGSTLRDEAVSMAAIALGIIVVLYNVLAVIVHLLGMHRFDYRAVIRMALKIVTNPLILACVIGLFWNLWSHSRGIEMPMVIERTILLLGGFALPLALLCVGGVLAATPARGIARDAMLAASLKTVIGPLAAVMICHLMDVSPVVMVVSCVMLGAPTAVASYVLTEQLDGDPQLAAGTIVTSSLLSAATLSVVVALLS